MSFLTNLFFWLILGVLVFAFSAIGYLAESRNKSNKRLKSGDNNAMNNNESCVFNNSQIVSKNLGVSFETGAGGSSVSPSVQSVGEHFVSLEPSFTSSSLSNDKSVTLPGNSASSAAPTTIPSNANDVSSSMGNDTELL